jgi:hypothetical protein
MKKFGILVTVAAILAPTSFAAAGGTNPMSQGYNARARGSQATAREETRQQRMHKPRTMNGQQQRQ